MGVQGTTSVADEQTCCQLQSSDEFQEVETLTSLAYNSYIASIKLTFSKRSYHIQLPSFFCRTSLCNVVWDELSPLRIVYLKRPKLNRCRNVSITVKSAFTPSATVLVAANKAREMFYFLNRPFTCLTNETFVPLSSALVQPHLECAIPVNCPYLKKDKNHRERIQRAETRWVKGLRVLTNEERPQALKLQKA